MSGVKKKERSKKGFSKGFNINKSLFIRRAVAVAIDWYLASVLAGIPVLFIYSMSTGDANIATSLAAMSTNLGLIAGVLAIIAASSYYVLLPLYWKSGQTVGKRLLGIKITSLDNEKININQLFKREIIGVMIVEGGIICSSEYLRQMITLVTNINVYKVLSLIALAMTVVSIVLVIFSKEKRMLHDFISETKVVELKAA